MKILRSMVAVLMAFFLLVFSIYNWQPVELMLWHNLVLETKVPVLVVLAFLLGFVPLLAYHSSVKWGLKRRIKSLENSLKMSAAAQAREPQAQPSLLPAPAIAPAAAAAVENSVDKSGTGTGEAGEMLSTVPLPEPRA